MTKKIIAIFSSVLILAGSVAPVFAESSIQISGNGSGTENVSNVAVTQTTQVSQSNSANISNDVHSSSNTGGNSANYNTGGNVSVDTGNAKTQVSIANNANTNVANTDCNCGAGDLSVKISGNGANSENTANTTLQNTTTLAQTNAANISNDVHATSNSGDNDANRNTGGSVEVMTGSATTKVNLLTNANQNLASIGGSAGVAGNGSNASVIISGNGSGSDNKVNLGLTDWVTLGQANSANVDNDVYAKSNTGDNDAKYNTGGNDVWGDNGLGGDVTIDTGNATTEVSADTAVNFNQAAIGCDCLMGVTAKISGNGASGPHWWEETESTINASLTNGQVVGQANGGEGIDNDLNGYAKSGYNDANSNTAESADPSISTGDATDTTSVHNTGNANVLGGDMDLSFPWWNGSNTNVSLTFSLQDLLLALGLNH